MERQTNFNLYVRNSGEMAQVQKSTYAACSKNLGDVDAFRIADLLGSIASNDVKQHLDTEVVNDLLEDTSAEPDVTITEDTQSFASVLEGCFETVDLTAPNADVHDSKGKAATVQNFSCEKYTAAELVAQLGQMGKIPHQLSAMS